MHRYLSSALAEAERTTNFLEEWTMQGAELGEHGEILRLIGLDALMAESAGRPEITVGLVDGPVRMDHPSLETGSLRSLGPGPSDACSGRGPACDHGTFIAGILAAKRSFDAPGVCPGCTVMIRPIFADGAPGLPGATATELAAAIVACVDGGARIINLSVAVRHAAGRGRQELTAALDHAAKREVVIVAAAGNDGAVAGSAVTLHPWVLPVIAYDRRGGLLGYSNLTRSIGQRGVGAPGDPLLGLGVEGARRTPGGTSAAAAFVTGAAALLWSLSPRASGSALRQALGPAAGARVALVPRLFDARAARRRLFEAVGWKTSQGQGA